MYHIVYLESRFKTIDHILMGSKSMLVKGAMSRRIPYDRVEVGDILCFVVGRRNLKVRATAIVSEVLFSDKLSENESYELLESNRGALRLHTSQWKKYAGKQFLTLITISNVQKENSKVLKEMPLMENDDWLLVDNLESLLLETNNTN